MESITMTHRTEQIAGAAAMCTPDSARAHAGTRGWLQGTTVPSAGHLDNSTGFGYIAVDTVPFKGDVYPHRGGPPV